MSLSPSSALNSGQLIARSRQFFIAAGHVFDHPRSQDRQVRVPLLLLIAQGIEAFLKAVLLTQGQKISALSRPPYGHDLLYMWDLDEMELLRHEVISYATNAEERAFATGRMTGPKSPDPAADFLLHLQRLSILHTKPSNYALRYLPDTDGTTPPPHLLLYCFDRVIEKIISSPADMVHLIGQPCVDVINMHR